VFNSLRNCAALGLEPLEGRDVMSATINGSVLTFNGGSGNDFVEIRDAGAAGQVRSSSGRIPLHSSRSSATRFSRS
jgi:hypothetical protein